ncbi:MAG: TIGR00730 family Rossman fold protein, partial [Candidatus Magasanikbacteria bacterium CG10_big_fil_rev_8_21_14_0_10_43_6]
MKKEHIKKMQEQGAKAFGSTVHEVEDYRQSWRIFRIMAELVEGYQFLQEMEKEVTVLGSARFGPDHPYYAIAREFGGLLAEGGFTTITGGGPGVMEATNRGAFEKKGMSVGLNIELPFEQVLNPYVTKFTSFNYFFTRKVMLTSPATAFVYFPGGFGTMDEFFEVVDLMALGMINDVPIVLVGRDYWMPVVKFLEESCMRVGSLVPANIKDWHIVDTAQEAYEAMKHAKDTPKGLCDLSANNFHCEGDIDWKIFRVMGELVEGFEFLTGLSHDITVLGTKTIKSTNRYYAEAEDFGRKLAEAGYAVVTGGRTGIAEAANKGAYEADGVSIGLGVSTKDNAENLNEYLTKSLTFKFPFTRKLIVTAPSEGFVFFPGGFGTLHQLFE